MSTEPNTTPGTVPGIDVYRGIAAVTKALSREGISKDKSNSQQGYKFRGIDDIYNALSAILAGADLCILPRMSDRTQEERQTAKGGVLFYVTVRAEFDFVSARDGSKHTVVMYGEAMDSGDKATNKAMSAAYKYAAMQVFCIPTEGMAEDADAVTHTVQPRPPQPPLPPPQAGPQPVKQRNGLMPVKGSTEETKLRELIRDSFGKLRQKFIAGGVEAKYVEILGAHGYMDSSEIPANRDLALSIVNELKQALADMEQPA